MLRKSHSRSAHLDSPVAQLRSSNEVPACQRVGGLSISRRAIWLSNRCDVNDRYLHFARYRLIRRTVSRMLPTCVYVFWHGMTMLTGAHRWPVFRGVIRPNSGQDHRLAPSMGTTSDTLGMVICRCRGEAASTLAEALGLAQTNSHETPAARPGRDRRSGQRKGRWRPPASTGPRASVRACSYHASPGACQANVLCISLWMISVNMLVNHRVAVDGRGCGKVDNRPDIMPQQVAGLRLSTGGAEYPQASCASCSSKCRDRQRLPGFP